ncbi:E3 ubiquitin-protein ligase RNF213 [Oryzias melastigma]|uniref:E3 ubiquitin-protein ligase RNF213 n=1 Tax=Oryzias melastigma TaxID=30732 RepID=A0A834CTQ7_ORYME|nr:E3 ubiquitin-protein ligase RNF213 [Oryzias melastigma]
MQASYLPTMPEDMVALAREALAPMQLQWYTCPNGHPCTIGECGQPMQMSRCVDCGLVIGGQNHAPVQGFQHLQFQGDRTQPGHILGDPRNRDNPDMMDTKGLSSVPFTTLRMLTHISMLLGFCQHPQPISAIIKPPVADPAAFLFEHLDKDLKHLIRSLGKGTDDTICAVHLLISSLLEPQQQQRWPVPYDNRLSTKQARNAWDVEMSNAVITPQLKDLERRLKEVNNFIRSDSRISANPVMTLVFGDPKHFLASLHPNSLIHCSAVWSCRQKVSLLSLKHIVEQNDGKDTLPVLWRFLNREAEIRLVKHLPDILTLQKNLVKKFQNTCCCHDDKAQACAPHALVSYLIAVHNDLIYCVDKHTGEETSFKVSPADLTELHVIHYELERDVMPLVLSNTQYSIQKGQETLHEYDLPKIQQQIISRFLLGKPLLTLNGIPTLINRHERNYEIIFKDVKGKVKQESLQTLTLASIAGELQSYSEVCEALSTLEVALGFLAMTGGEPHMQLSHYLEEVLQMGNQVAEHILKTLSMCCLKHCVALWQLLASLKSENMLRLKRMHEFMVLVLKTPNATDTYKPDWGLKETLVSYMERKDLDIPPDVEELFPEQICLSHYVEAWKFIVTFKQERAQRG